MSKLYLLVVFLILFQNSKAQFYTDNIQNQVPYALFSDPEPTNPLDPNLYHWSEITAAVQRVRIFVAAGGPASLYVQKDNSYFSFNTLYSFVGEMSRLEMSYDGGTSQVIVSSHSTTSNWVSTGSLSLGKHSLSVTWWDMALNRYDRNYDLYVVPQSQKFYIDDFGNTITAWTGNGNTGKPIIISEGFDPYNKTFSEYLRFSGDALFTKLLSNGYRIYFINYYYSAHDIRYSAAVYNSASKYISTLTGNTTMIAAGISMGGVIVRYALAKAETDGTALPFTKFISIDAPQQGAVISLPLQNFIKDNSDADDYSKFALHNIAASQLLNQYAYEGTAHNDFYNEMKNLNNGLGYPKLTLNIGVSFSNGSPNPYTGKWLDIVYTGVLGTGFHGFSGNFDLTDEEKVAGSYLPLSMVQNDPATVFWGHYSTTLHDKSPTFIPYASSLDLDPVSHASKFDETIQADSNHSHDEFPPEIIAVLFNSLTDPPLTIQHSFVEQNTMETEPPHYDYSALLLAPATILNNGIKQYFRYWNDGIFVNPRRIYPITNTTFTAVYKATHLSSTATGFSNNSQRKIVRTRDGAIHIVYESMGRIWYEKSTDNGLTWTIMNNGQPLGSEFATSPSIDYYASDVAIVWHDIGASAIFVAFFPYYSIIPIQVVAMTYSAYSATSVHPVIVWGADGWGMVVWEKGCNINNILGLGYTIFQMRNWIGFQCVMLPEGFVPGSSANSTNPTISATKNSSQQIYHLAWQENNGTSSSSILYRNCSVDYMRNTVFGSLNNLSDGSGLDTHINPSLVAFGDGARVCWNGTIDDNNYVVFHDPGNASRYWFFYGVVNGPTIAKQSTMADPEVDNFYCFGWSKGSSSVYATCKLDGMESIPGFTGPDVKMVNGYSTNTTAPDGMSAMNFKNATLPYSFAYSATLPVSGPIILDKTSGDNGIRTGRKGLIQKDSAQFSFSLGDIACENKQIGFKPMSPEQRIENLGDLNTWVQTKPFTVTDKSTLLYSIQFGVNDTNKAAKALADGKAVSFTVQLIDDLTNRVIWDCDKVIYDRSRLQQYDNLANELSMDGIGGTKTVRLALKVAADSTATCVMADMFAQGSVLAKARLNKKVLGAGVKITSYAISQNYPNPFNPTTVINYQLPKAGRVTLRIYDMLGKEVIKLVDEEKSAGSYQAEFNASHLASGVYFYQIECNDFKAIKKMTLIK